MDLGSLKRALIVLRVSSPNYWKHIYLQCEYALGESFAFGILQYSQNVEMNWIFFGLDVVMSILDFA